MSRTIGVVDYGSTGNIESIRKALVAAGAQVRIIDDARNLSGADKLVLPGVGSFAEAMRQVRERGMFDPLISAAASTPILGICLGMQMLARVGYEFGETSGFGLIDGEVRPVVCKAAIPHIGFKQIRKIGDSPLFHGLASDAEFYFMHSYEFVNYTDVAGLTTHGEHQFVSAVAKSHLFGVQFHPEKSRDAGIRLLKNFVEL